jgi:hypothetical protein
MNPPFGFDPRDYVIEHTGRKWGPLLRRFGDLLPVQFDILMVNKFGDVILIQQDGSAHILDVGAGVMISLADDLDQFTEMLAEHGRNWLLVPLADECAAHGLGLKPGQCYSYRTPPLIGGPYELSNIYVAELEAHYAFLGELHRQTHGLPDGARISQLFRQ